MRLGRHALALTYYLALLALIAVGCVLWATGHGTGDPYLSFGIVFALAPAIVFSLRRLLHRR